MAIERTAKVRGLIACLSSQQARAKLAASKALRELSQRQPELLYPHFKVLAALLGHENNILKWNATLALANLAGVDQDGRLDRMLDAYLAPSAGLVMITAANAIKGAAMIAVAKPHLADRIAKHLLRVEKARFATPECRNIAIGHALEALGKMIKLLSDPQAALKFAARHVDNPRRATANKAQKLCSAGTLPALQRPQDLRRRRQNLTTRLGHHNRVLDPDAAETLKVSAGLDSHRHTRL
jgi:hypothetical protein